MVKIQPGYWTESFSNPDQLFQLGYQGEQGATIPVPFKCRSSNRVTQISVCVTKTSATRLAGLNTSKSFTKERVVGRERGN